MTQRYQKFSPEFREETAKLVLDHGRRIVDVAREVGVGETTVGNCVKANREKNASEEPPLELSERARLRELQRRNRELEATFLSLDPPINSGERFLIR